MSTLCRVYLVIIYIIICSSFVTSADSKFKFGEKKLSEYVLAILDHYKQPDPVGLPGAPIPDPMDIPPFSHSFSIGRMHFENVKVYGLKRFRIININADLAAMQVRTALQVESLNVLGNYTLSTFLSKSQGPFTIQLADVYIDAVARLDVEREGHLEAQEINMDTNFKSISMNFERLGFFASVFQGMINSVGTFVFDSIKPFILSEVNTNMRNDVNKQIRQLPQRFPNSISPLDQVIAEARHKVREYKFDPFYVDDYNYTTGILGIKMTHTWLNGLSSFHRIGKVTFEIKNQTMYFKMDIGTQKLLGSTQWEVLVMGGMMSRAGTASFSVDHIKVEVAVSQTMDIRNSPQLDDIQLELGNIQVRCDGAGTFDYLIEFGVNVFPNLLRYQIMDALESPIKTRVQELFDSVNIEQELHENLPKLDEYQKSGFKGIIS